jgi:predicted cupin superfamily sugar epimerase
MTLPKAAADIIARLDLKPHPEGGHYRETFRDTGADSDGRARSTAIYFLLARGERSHWHRPGIITRVQRSRCGSPTAQANAA